MECQPIPWVGLIDAMDSLYYRSTRRTVQMAKQGFKILDSDMHVMEPPDLWERYIGSKYKSRLPGVSLAKTCAISVRSIPTAENGPERRPDKTGQTEATTLNAIRRSIELTQSE